MDAWADCNLQRSTQHPGVHRVPPNDSSKNARKPDRITASQCRSASHGIAAKRLYIRWWSYGSLPYGVCKNAPILFRILACEHAFGMRVIAHRQPGGAAG